MRVERGLAAALFLMIVLGTSTIQADTGPCLEDPHQRAGNPQHVSCLAVPSNNSSFIGYFVGGGSPLPHFSQPHGVSEGTWGWDFSGWLFHRRVVLGWWNTPHYQGGTGGYKTDGPRHEPPGERTHGEE